MTKALRPRMCAAARAVLGWSMYELALRAGVAYSTVADFERGARSPIRNNLAAIKRAFEYSDIEFIDADGRWGVSWINDAGERESATLPHAQ